MPAFSRFTSLLLLSTALSACRPSSTEAETEKQPPAAAPVSQNGIPLPPEIVAATGLAAKDERAEIILLLPDTRIAMQEFQRNGLAMLVGRQAGCHLTTQDAGGSAQKQAEQFREAIAAKPAAIFISPIDPPALAALMVEAKTSGIAIIGLDSRMLRDGCTTVIYSNPQRIGRLAAETTLEALKRKANEEGRSDVTGRVVQLRGAEKDHLSDQIAEGFIEGLKAEPGVILVHDAAAGWNADEAGKRTAEAFQLQKNFDAIYAHNDAMALGAAKAAEAVGERENVLIVGTDGLSGQKRGLELVREGGIEATIVQPALVDLALQIILKLRSDPNFKPQPAYEIEPFAVMPRNVEQALRTGTYKLPRL